MKKQLIFLISFLCYMGSFSAAYGQDQCGDFNPGVRDESRHPKNDAEWEIYVSCVVNLNGTIGNDTLAKYFAEAELVIEGDISINEAFYYIDKQHKSYQIKPYTVFKGSIAKGKMIEVVADIDTSSNYPSVGSWNNNPFPKGVFFLRKAKEKKYEFINNKNAWISYNRFVDPVLREKQLDKIVHHKIAALPGAKCQKTSFYYKKKENLENQKKISDTPAIHALSHDVIPAGILTGDGSLLTIYGTDLF